MKKELFIAIMAVAISLASCSEDDSLSGGSNEKVTIQLPEHTRAVADVQNQFAFDLSRICCEASDDNFVVSPFSVMSTLSMCANGDDGVARDEILGAFNFSSGEDGLRSLNDYFNTLLAVLPKVDNTTTCTFGNSVWYNPAYTIQNSFRESVGSCYNADFFNVRIWTQEGMSEMNKWISNKTEGVIADFLKMPLQTDLAVVNAAYFKGKWEHPFEVKDTRPGKFHNLEGSVAETEFMNTVGEFWYCNVDGIEMISLPYGNGNFKMVIMIPESADGFANMSRSIDSDTFVSMQNSLKPYEVTLSMPRFEVEFNEDIVNYIHRLGMQQLSEDGLNAIFDKAVVISTILHGASIKVDEEGSVAAAVTVATGLTDVGPVGSVKLSIDRPFLFLLTETTTGAILFQGQVVRF